VQARQPGFHILQQRFGIIVILDICRIHDYSQNQSQRADQQMTFAAPKFFDSSDARSLDPRGLHLLIIQDGRTALRLAPFEFEKRSLQDTMNALPSAVHSPTPVIAVQRFPKRRSCGTICQAWPLPNIYLGVIVEEFAVLVSA